jgi:hypothetical protein
MKEDLDSFSKTFVGNHSIASPINTLWADFKQQCNKVIESHVPSKLTSSRFNQPWCNRNIRKLARRKKRAYRRARKSKEQTEWNIYRQIQKENQKACRNARNEYVRDMISEPGGNNKKLYSYVKSMKSDSSGVAPLKKDGSTYSDASAKADILNDQFSSVFTKEDCENLPDLGQDISVEAPTDDPCQWCKEAT